MNDAEVPPPLWGSVLDKLRTLIKDFYDFYTILFIRHDEEKTKVIEDRCEYPDEIISWLQTVLDKYTRAAIEALIFAREQKTRSGSFSFLVQER